ncbi:MAG: hypothetical protein ABDH18_03125 [Aquificaceae bacterium]
MLRSAINLPFLILAYNYFLYHISSALPVVLFPIQLKELLILSSFTSALYLAWLFGERARTVLWLGYVFLFQIIAMGFTAGSFEVVLEFTPSFLITLLLIWVFESPTEKRINKLKYEKERLEHELDSNTQQINQLTSQIEILKELIKSLEREKQKIEQDMLNSKEFELTKLSQLEVEKLELEKKLEHSQRLLEDYSSRLERLTNVNRELFEMLESFSEPRQDPKSELSRLRQERKRLIKETSKLSQELEECLDKHKSIEREYLDIQLQLSQERISKQKLQLEVESLRSRIESKIEVYSRFFDAILDNIEFEPGAIEEFSALSPEMKRVFFKKLTLLNDANPQERFETLREHRGIFKLKPKGGRIYFTHGKARRWKVIGILWGEDPKSKSRYLRDMLSRYDFG